MGAAQALLLSFLIALLVLENYGYGYWMISRPIFAGPLVGLIMGDFQTGLYVGATVELMYMGILPIGGSVPPNAQIAGTISTVFAIVSGDADVGITLAMPIGVLAQFLIMLAWNINILLEHKADKYIEADDIKGIEHTHLLGLLVFFLVFFISSFCAIYFGSDAVKALVDHLPSVINKGLSVASKLLPAVGMAMLLKMMDFKTYWCYFLGGFVLVAYLNLNTTAVSLIALVIAVAIYKARQQNKENDDDFADEETVEEHKALGLLDEKDLKATFWRSFFSMTTINYERYCALGFDYAMIPAIRKLYPNREDQIAALRRHNEFFNCHPYTGNLVLGVTLALEEEKAAGKDVSEEAIRSTKAALMGPLSGIGDSIFKAVFMTLFAALAAGLALDGNPIAPWVFIIPNVALNVLSRWYFIKQGHKFGVDFVSKMTSSDALDQFVAGATIVGMMVVGSMTVSFVRVPLNIVITSGGTDLNLLDMINFIIPSILPLLVVIWFYSIMRKHEKGMYSCILLCFVIGIVGAALHLF